MVIVPPVIVPPVIVPPGAQVVAAVRTLTGSKPATKRSARRCRLGRALSRSCSLAFADGLLYLRSEEGTMILVEPSREEYVERGRFEQPDRTRSPAWTHPVIANGKLYVRDQDMLFCYDVKGK